MKVIFLDIDGPMIPTSMLLHDPMASFDRKFPVTTIAVLNRMVKETGAKVVLNTTHNISVSDITPYVPDIDKALMRGGLHTASFHEDRFTKYPTISRADAVKDWLHRHPEVEEWIALDDILFTDDDRLIWIDPDTGITLKHLLLACTKLGGKPPIILM